MRLLGRRPPADATPSPRANGGLAPITFPSGPYGISRESAVQLSVVSNASTLIKSIAAQLSVDRLRGDEKLDPGTLLTAPDPDTTWPAMIGWTVDDLIFYGQAAWYVLRRDTEGQPTRARRLPPGSWAVRLSSDYGRLSRIEDISVGGQSVAVDDVIRIATPGNGILYDGAAIVLAALTLQNSADRFANIPLPAGVLTNTGQEIGPDDAAQIVTDFDLARENGATAFLQSMTYERTQLAAADLQLVESVAAMDTRLARLLNVPVSMVAASPTGSAHAQLYANVPQNLTQLVQQAVAPYLVCIEDAITYQATPRGQNVVFNTSDWLRFAQVSMVLPQSGAGAPPLTPEGAPQ
jgi:hypothetical protein